MTSKKITSITNVTGITNVMCVKVGSIRPKYQNLQEWMKNPRNIYIGRGGIVFIDNERFPKQDSIWHNPYKIGKDGTRDEVLEKYRTYIVEKLKSGKIKYETLLKLKGKNLDCWCKPEPCHGDILVEIIENCIL